MQLKHIGLTPLANDLQQVNIGEYLLTSDFERLCIQNRWMELWISSVQIARSQKRAVMVGFNHRPDEAKRAYIILLDRVFHVKSTFDTAVYITFKNYLKWTNEKVYLENVFQDLRLLNFPNEWLRELQELYQAKQLQFKEQSKKIEEEKQVSIDTKEIPTPQKVELSLDEKKKLWKMKIAKAKTSEVIDELADFILENYEDDDDLEGDIINQSQRWYRLKDKINNNIIDADTEQTECNKINIALREIINKL